MYICVFGCKITVTHVLPTASTHAANKVLRQQIHIFTHVCIHTYKYTHKCICKCVDSFI